MLDCFRVDRWWFNLNSSSVNIPFRLQSHHSNSIFIICGGLVIVGGYHSKSKRWPGRYKNWANLFIPSFLAVYLFRRYLVPGLPEVFFVCAGTCAVGQPTHEESRWNFLDHHYPKFTHWIYRRHANHYH